MKYLVLCAVVTLALAGCAQEELLTGKELSGLTVAVANPAPNCAAAAAALEVFEEAGCVPATTKKAALLIRQTPFVSRPGGNLYLNLTVTRRDGAIVASRNFPLGSSLSGAADLAEETARRLAKLYQANKRFLE